MVNRLISCSSSSSHSWYLSYCLWFISFTMIPSLSSRIIGPKITRCPLWIKRNAIRKGRLDRRLVFHSFSLSSFRLSVFHSYFLSSFCIYSLGAQVLEYLSFLGTYVSFLCNRGLSLGCTPSSLQHFCYCRWND